MHAKNVLPIHTLQVVSAMPWHDRRVVIEKGGMGATALLQSKV